MQRLWKPLLLCAAYLGTAKLGLHFASVHPSATAIWPPTGIAIVAFLVLGRGAVLPILIGAFLANITTAGSLFTSLAIAIGNTLEGAVCAFLVARFANGVRAFERATDVFRYAGFTAVANLISATIGTIALSFAHFAPWSLFPSIWLTWFLGDLAGGLLFGPLLLAFVVPQTIVRQRAIEAAFVLLCLLVSVVVVFGGLIPATDKYPLIYVCVPPLVWAALRFGLRETMLALVALSAAALFGTLHGTGPFVVAGPYSLVLLQSFMATNALMAVSMVALGTERRKAEGERRTLLQAEQAARTAAEAANAAKDDFVAMLGHELRNPLAAITTASKLLVRTSSNGSSKAHDILARQTKQLAHIVDDLLDVSRVTAHGAQLSRAPIDFGALTERALEGLSEQTADHVVTIKADSVWVDGDETRLHQIVTNLVTNAVKYTPTGGTIDVSVSEVDGHAQLTVIDNGIGISADLLPHVFEAFAQGPRSLDRALGGLGVGLTLVRTLVLLHSGTVTARSSGRGSTLTVLLPRIDPPEAAQRIPTPAIPMRPRRLLIVEDQPDTREVMRMALEDAGHIVFEAVNGPSAIDAAERVQPDVAIVDIGLPIFDGYEVARRLRRTPAGARMLLVALTGYGQPEDRKRSAAAGFDVHLVKPIEPQALDEVLAKEPIH